MQKIQNRVLFLIVIALVVTSGCMSPASTPAPAPPATGMPDIVLPRALPPATAPPATVEIMTQTAACQVTDSVSIEGTVRSTASRPVTIVVRGSSYNAAGIKLGSGSDLIDIGPDSTSAFKLSILNGCGPWDWRYYVWIDEVH